MLRKYPLFFLLGFASFSASAVTPPPIPGGMGNGPAVGIGGMGGMGARPAATPGVGRTSILPPGLANRNSLPPGLTNNGLPPGIANQIIRRVTAP